MVVMNPSPPPRAAAPTKHKRRASARRSVTAKPVPADTRKKVAARKTKSVCSPTKGEEATRQADLDATVEKINALAWEGHHSDIEIGKELLQNVFGGDRANLGGKGKNPSWRALAAREDVELSHGRLWQCLHLHLQAEDLRRNGVDPKSLRVSHQRLLLPLKDLVVKAKLARQAAAKSWTVKKLEEEVRNARGKPQVAGHLKALKALPKLIDALADVRVEASDVESLGGAQRVTQIRDSLERQLKVLPALLKSLNAVLKQHPPVATAPATEGK
jgi:hypothetical protein